MNTKGTNTKGDPKKDKAFWNPPLRFILAAMLLLGGPFVAVRLVRRDLRPLLNTPQARLKGDSAEKVIIVEYSDFQCSACAAIQPGLKKLLETYQGKIGFGFKHYPLMRRHKNAYRAAQAAECAAQDDLFWPFHDRLFETQKT